MSPESRSYFLKDQTQELQLYLPRVALIAIPIVLSFWLVDRTATPEAASTTLAIRLLWVAIHLGNLLVAYRLRRFRALELGALVGILGSIAASVGIDLMTGSTDRLVLRVVLILVVATLLTVRYRVMCIVMATALILPNVVLVHHGTAQEALLTANAYLLAGSLLYTTVCTSRISRMRQLSELKAALAAHQQETERLARVDALTGLWNRRHFFELAERELARAQRGGWSDMVVLMLDIDHFKKINDTFGHAAGDEVLKSRAALWGELVRRGDILGRVGGEEFAVLMPATSLAEGRKVAERLRKATASAPVTLLDQKVSSTISVGGTLLNEGEDLETALRRADRQLYAAKRAGRDLVAMDEGRGSPGASAIEPPGK